MDGHRLGATKGGKTPRDCAVLFTLSIVFRAYASIFRALSDSNRHSFTLCFYMSVLQTKYEGQGATKISRMRAGAVDKGGGIGYNKKENAVAAFS